MYWEDKKNQIAYDRQTEKKQLLLKKIIIPDMITLVIWN